MDSTTPIHNTEDLEARQSLNQVPIVSPETRKSLSLDESILNQKSGVIAPPAPWWKRLLTDQAFLVFICALIGFGIGMGLKYKKTMDQGPDGTGDASDINEVITWVKLFGDLFLQALKCCVLPLVVISIVLVVRDMMMLGGQVVSIGGKTVAFYLFTSLAGAVNGVCMILLFMPYFSNTATEFISYDPVVKFTCPGGVNNVIQTDPSSGALSCGPVTASSTTDNSQFTLVDVNGVLYDAGKYADKQGEVSISDTIQTSMFRKLVAKNLVSEYQDNNFIALIIFAIIFAIASTRAAAFVKNGGEKQSAEKTCRHVIKVLEDLQAIFSYLIMILVRYCTYGGVMSVVAGAFAGQPGTLTESISDIGALMACSLIAMAIHGLILYPGLYLIFVRENPFPYMWNYFPAMAFAFSTASSAATIPITNACAMKMEKKIPANIRQFVISLGATINMDGTAIYYSTCAIFLAINANMADKLNVGSYFVIALLATLGSAGASPTPGGGFVMPLIIYNSVLGANSGTPAGYAFIMGIDWFMDRCMTMMNVVGDSTALGIISAIAARAENASESTKADEKAEAQPVAEAM